MWKRCKSAIKCTIISWGYILEVQPGLLKFLKGGLNIRMLPPILQTRWATVWYSKELHLLQIGYVSTFACCIFFCFGMFLAWWRQNWLCCSNPTHFPPKKKDILWLFLGWFLWYLSYHKFQQLVGIWKNPLLTSFDTDWHCLALRCLLLQWHSLSLYAIHSVTSLKYSGRFEEGSRKALGALSLAAFKLLLPPPILLLHGTLRLPIGPCIEKLPICLCHVANLL